MSTNVNNAATDALREQRLKMSFMLGDLGVDIESDNKRQQNSKLLALSVTIFRLA
ncbi:MAG: hypothetical protein K0R82_2867 [Flavipsychrobacter sp.]|jgi:hypothetical protein|nr:hypothetical protein [Flavipsychrobacter sp.]